MHETATRNVFFWKKRAPARQTPGVVSELVFTKNPQIWVLINQPELLPHPHGCHRHVLPNGTPQTPFLMQKSSSVIQNGSKTIWIPIIPLIFPEFPLYFDPKTPIYVFFWKGTCFFWKKRAPARQTPGVVAELGFTKIHTFTEHLFFQLSFPENFKTENIASKLLNT